MKHPPRVYVTGASCSGVSTLGEALSRVFRVRHLDVDDYYWMPTNPPFVLKRPPEDRVRLIQGQQARAGGWVLTGSFIGWGDSLVSDVDLVIFLHTPTAVRMQRLETREFERHGARILKGGDMYEAHLAFKDWASRYDDPLFSGRNVAQHERWLMAQTAPVLRLSGDASIEGLVERVKAVISGR